MVDRGSRITLSIQEKIALHLGEFTNLKEDFEVPFAITQDGIAKAINIERSNLPRELKKIINRGFVEERVAHVIGKSRRRKTYNLTPEGKVHANQIKYHLNKIPIIYKEPDGSKVKTNLLKLYYDLKPKISLFEIINNISDDGEFEQAGDVFFENDLKLDGIQKPDSRLIKTLEKAGPSIVQYLDHVPQIRHFFGRMDELKQINDWLKTPSNKVIVIYGIAGIGKTTLLSKLIRQYKKSKGTFWYRCHESDTVKTIITPISVFLANYGKNKLKNYLETKKIVNIVEISDILENELQNIDAILVFDDFQKVDKTILQFFSILLNTIEKLPGIKFIISTRKLVPFYDTRDISLKRTVTELQLQGLDKKSSLRLLKLQKFKQIDDMKFDTIYESTAGHPLALELLTPLTETEHKSDFTRFIEDEIFSELSSEQKNILNAASVHRYPIDLQGFFVDEDTNYDQLSELLKRSLVYKLTNNRYDLHDLVREFVLNHLTENQRQYYHRNATQYYSLKSSSEAVIELLYHLVKAHQFKDAASLAIEKGQELINSGHLELNYILEELNTSTLPVGLKSDILLLKGDVVVATGNLDTAFEYYEESLKLILKTGKRIKLAKIYRKMAVLFSHQNDWVKAIEFYNKSLKIFQSEGETKELAKIYNNLALIYYYKNDNKKTIDFYNKSIDLLDQLDEKKGITITYNNLGKIFEDNKQYKKAFGYYNKSLSIAKANNDKPGIAAAYSHIGAIELKKGNLKKANISFKRCMELINESDFNQEYAMLSIDIANLFYDNEGYDSALKYYENGIKGLMELQSRPDTKPSSFWQKYILKDTISEHLQESIQEFSQTTILQDKLAKIYNRIGNIFRTRGNWAEAINNHERTLEIFRGIGELKKIALAYTDLGIDYSNSGNYEKALYYYQKCYGLLKGTDELIGLAVTLSNIGKIYENSNNFKKALNFYKRSLKVSQKAKYRTGIKKAYKDLSQIYKKNNDIKSSNKYFELSKRL